MSQSSTKLPVNKTDDAKARAAAIVAWNPFGTLRRQIDELVDDFGSELWPSFGRPGSTNFGWASRGPWGILPAMEVAEKDKSYEISAELPGLAEKDIDVKVANGVLTISGEKKEEKEEKKQDHYFSERHYGSFARSFRVPEGADADKIEAHLKNGVLTVTLPKTAEAQKSEKKIAIKTA